MKNLKELEKEELIDSNGGIVPFLWPLIFPKNFKLLFDDRIFEEQIRISPSKYK